MNKKIKLLILGISFIGFGILFFTIFTENSCTLRSCKLPEIMMEVAKTQLKIQENIINSSVPFNRDIQAPLSKHLSFSYVNDSGIIVVQSSKDDFEVIFEPRFENNTLKWLCNGKPQLIFDLKNPSNIADCGEKYRNVITQ